MPPVNTVISPTGATIHGNDRAESLARIAELRAGALATPISNEWDAEDMATYLFYLDETEAHLTEKAGQ
jgi:hypothetical protein